jgi:hypothetical protein
VVVPEVGPLHGLALEPPHVFNAWDHSLQTVEFLTGILATISPRRTDETAALFSYGMIVMALDPLRRELTAHVDRAWPDERSHRALLLLAALLHTTSDDPINAARIAERRAQDLRLSNGERQRLGAAVEYYHLAQQADLSPLAIYRYWRETDEAGIDACLLSLADYLATYGAYLKQDEWIIQLDRVKALLTAWYRQRETLVDPPRLIDGNQLKDALHLKRGPLIGELLELIREAQVTGDVKTYEDALAFAQKVLSAK